jgi:hypothetical protein
MHAVILVWGNANYSEYSCLNGVRQSKEHRLLQKLTHTYNHIFAIVRESMVLGGPKGVMRLISSVEQLEPR